MTEYRKRKKICEISGQMFLLCLLLFFAAGLTFTVCVVYHAEPLPADIAIQDFFFDLRNSSLNILVKAITHLSDPAAIIILCAVLLLLPSRKSVALPVSFGALAGLLIYKPMKHIVLRSRPDAVFHLVEQGGYSFPSGHSVTSVIVYGLLFYFIRKYCKNKILRQILSALCFFLMIFIGLSRIYVGVHWPSDVLAGWCVGGAVLLCMILLIERRERKNENI